MNNMKRLFAVLMVLSVMLCFAACTDAPANSTPAATTTTPAPSTPVASTPATTPSTAPTTPTYTYRIRVVDENGAPIEGATVQLCLEMCSFTKTDAEGYAYFKNDIADGHKARILVADGYTFSEEDTYLESGATELTLVATKIAE